MNAPTPAPGQAPSDPSPAFIRSHRLSGSDPSDDVLTYAWGLTTSKAREFWATVDDALAAASGPCPGCESLRRQCSEMAGDVGALAGALHEIQGAHEGGTHAHDTAHAALDRLHGLRPKPAPETPAGQTAWEALHASIAARCPEHTWLRWDDLVPGLTTLEVLRRDDVEAAAQAVLKAGTCPHGDLAAEVARLRGLLNEAGIAEPRPAPELRAAMAETRKMRELVDEATSAALARARQFLPAPLVEHLHGIRKRAGLPS